MSDFRLGQHESSIAGLDRRLGTVETTVAGFDRKLDDILIHLAEKRGERKMLLLVASAVSAGVSAVIAVFKALTS